MFGDPVMALPGREPTIPALLITPLRRRHGVGIVPRLRILDLGRHPKVHICRSVLGYERAIGHYALVEPGHRRRRQTPMALTTSLLVLALLLSTCSSTRGKSTTATSPPPAIRVSGPSSTTTTAPLISNCGHLYTARGLSGVTQIGGCAASLSVEHVVQARVGVGDVFQLASIREIDGTPDVQAPTSDNPAIIQRTAASNRGGDATYRALTPGLATLRTSSIFCNGGPIDPMRPSQRICPVIQVTVEPVP
jgi:hypothetical protein